MRFQRVVAAVFLLCVFSVGIASVVLPDRDRTFFENRVLSQFPVFKGLTSVWNGGDGGFFAGVDDYLSDQIVGREYFQSAYVTARKLTGSRQTNGVVIGEGGELLPYRKHEKAALNLSLYSSGDGETQLVSEEEILLENEHALLSREDTPLALSTILEVQKAVEAEGGKLITVLVPHKRIMLYEKYPPYFQNDPSYAQLYDKTFAWYLEKCNSRCINLADMLTSVPNAYFTTDHHLNAVGAEAVYNEIMAEVNEWVDIKPLSFTATDVEQPFLGSYNRQLMGLYPIETAQILLPEGGLPEYVRRDNGNRVNYLYKYFDEVYINEWATYGIYMGGDVGNTVVSTGRDLPSVLMVGDSNTNILEPLLAATFGESHFIDMRYFGFPYSQNAGPERQKAERLEKGNLLLEYIQKNKPDIVLLLYTSPIQNIEFEIAK